MIVLFSNTIRVIRRNEMGRTCGTYGREENLNRVLVGKFVGKRQPSRPRYRWNDYIKLDLTGNKMKGRGLD